MAQALAPTLSNTYWPVLHRELDLSRLMGQPTENRTGFQAVELIADIDSDASPDELNEVLRLSELRCPV